MTEWSTILCSNSNAISNIRKMCFSSPVLRMIAHSAHSLPVDCLEYKVIYVSQQFNFVTVNIFYNILGLSIRVYTFQSTDVSFRTAIKTYRRYQINQFK